MPHPFALAFLVALLAPPTAWPTAPAAVQSSEEGEGQRARPQEPPRAAELALSAADRERLEHLRSVLANEGRVSARALLEETVAGLAGPAAGEKAAHVAYLLALDGVAEELGSLQESRRLRESVLAIRTRLLPRDHPDLLGAKQNLAATKKALGDINGAHELFQAVLEARTRLLPPEHPDLLTAKHNVARTKAALGDLNGARELQEAVLEARTRLLPPEHADLLRAKLNLAGTKKALGDVNGARELEEAVLEARTRLLPPEHPELLMTKLNLAGTKAALGDLAGARELEEAVLEVWTHLLPPDHPNLLAAKQNLAITKKALGDLAGARELQEAVLEVWTHLLPPDHPDLLGAKLNLAGTKAALGDLAGARELIEAVLEAWTRLLPPDHLDLLGTKQNLAATKKELGDLNGAHELYEAVLEARTRLLPPDHPDLLAAKQGLAGTKYQLGDIDGAHELYEAVLKARTRLLPPDHPDLLAAKQGLAATMYELGDLSGARELYEAVLEARTSLLPPDHPGLPAAKHGLAATMYELGDINGAHELFEAVVEARTRLLPPDHPDLLAAKQGLAATKHALGDLNGARELLEAVLEAQTRLLSPEHPNLLATKQGLAGTKHALGDLNGARELQEAVLEAQTRHLPPEHPHLLTVKRNLAGTKYELGDLDGARELVVSLLAGVRLRAGALRSEAARAAREGARVELRRLPAALFLGAPSDSVPALDPEFFATLEALRLASVASVEAAHALADRPELAENMRRVSGIRAALADLVSAGPQDAQAAEGWRAELLRLTEERDRAERGLRRKLAEAGTFAGEIDAMAVGGRLASGAAAVSFLWYPRLFEKDPATGERPPNVASLLALVVRTDGSVRRVELGPAAEIETLVRDWRQALGKPIERGIAAEEEEESSEEERGRALRARVLDPLLAAAGEEVRALHVVLDDVLFLVPLDALPLEGEERVGERYRIHVEPTMARLLSAKRPVAEEGTLVALGGIDFDAEPEKAERNEPEAPSALLAVATPPLERSGRPEAFEPLRQTRYEVEDLAEQFREARREEPVRLSGAAATKAALHAAAPKARYLHLATHGWFASESFKSQLDSLAEQSARESFQRAEATLTGFAPETLCGLALAGANRGKDALGRVPGILTAEELATFDLRNCELAVLSACETNVGIRRAGQGIQSLQTALHAAGARTAITSLWKVDDAATRRLFELFYTKLWREKLGKHEALWQAKMALRVEGHPPRDWAAWVLSGDPD